MEMPKSISDYVICNSGDCIMAALRCLMDACVVGGLHEEDANMTLVVVHRILDNFSVSEVDNLRLLIEEMITLKPGEKFKDAMIRTELKAGLQKKVITDLH